MALKSPGAITIGRAANVSAFQDLIVASLTPVVQVDFVYGINIQTGVSTVANAGTVDTNSSRLRVQSGVNAAGSAIYQTKRPARYRAGEGMLCRFTPVFATPQANSTQIMGAGNAVDGYFYGYLGTVFGLLHRIRGVDTWTPQSAWNGDKCDGTGLSGFNWNTAFGVPCQIIYPYLGFGDIFFYVQYPLTGEWILAHTIRYADTVATTQNGNPSLPFYAQALNTGNTVNLIMFAGSCGIFITGQRSFVGNPRWGAEGSNANVTTEIALITIKNCSSYNGVVNSGLVGISLVAMGASSAKGITHYRLKLNATLGGSPSFTPRNGSTADNGVTITSGNSIASFDVAGTTVTGGLEVFSFSSVDVGSFTEDMTPFELYLSPGDTLTLSAFSSVSAAVAASINWAEDV